MIFSEVSPRPHDTGMVTMATQWQNEFELHARAILGLPVETVEVNETGALGCAIAVAAATGAYPTLADAGRAMCPVGVRVEPDAAAHAAYDARYRMYKRIIEALDPIWDDMQKCVEGGANP